MMLGLEISNQFTISRTVWFSSKDYKSMRIWELIYVVLSVYTLVSSHTSKVEPRCSTYFISISLTVLSKSVLTLAT
jgi:hypothetical protein